MVHTGSEFSQRFGVTQRMTPPKKMKASGNNCEADERLFLGSDF